MESELPQENVLHTNAWANFLRKTADEEYCVLNNVWGLSAEEFATTRHYIKYDAETGQVNWSATIPEELFDPSKVRSYQQVYSGVKDSNLPKCGLDKFPCQIGQLSGFVTDIAINVATSIPRQSNAAAEIFLHTQKDPVLASGTSQDTRAFELMVWLQAPDPHQIDLNGLGRLTDTTPEYGLYLREGYAAFVMNQDVAALPINWLELIRVVAPYFPDIDFPMLWATSVEFGTELYSGSVEAGIARFSHTVTHADTGTGTGTGTDTGTDTGTGTDVDTGTGAVLNEPWKHIDSIKRLAQLVCDVQEYRYHHTTPGTDTDLKFEVIEAELRAETANRVLGE